jgi:hypothetical protein
MSDLPPSARFMKFATAEVQTFTAGYRQNHLDKDQTMNALRWMLFLPVAIGVSLIVTIILGILGTLLVSKDYFPISWFACPFALIAAGAWVIPKGQRACVLRETRSYRRECGKCVRRHDRRSHDRAVLLVNTLGEIALRR